ncbi:ABC transporter permease [Egicoccus sp. AB-alg2]|uniref:ABC transporter permease n=1 Tax=Egicoccus sp. AB-alg2 TaxID=3242693 RepID=UPI00359D2A17
MRLALREIRRSKLRFVLLAGAVGLLVFLLLFFQSVAGSLLAGFTGGLEQADADVVVYDATARANPVVSVLPMTTVDEVSRVSGVAEAAAVAQTFVVAASGGVEEEAILVGITPGAPGSPSAIAEGRLPTAPGEALASSGGFGEDFPVGATVQVGDDLDVEVVGIAADASYNVATTLYVPFDTYEQALADRLGPGGAAPASFVAVRAADGVAVEVLAQDIADRVPDVQALTRAEAVDALPGVDLISRSFGILYVLLYVVVTIVTGVFFLILTVQKRDALVLLRAVGAERADVVRLVLAQVLTVVGLGVLLGTGLAVGLLRATQDLFGSELAVSTIAASAAAVLVLGVIAASGAIRRVLQIEPVEATQAAGLG